MNKELITDKDWQPTESNVRALFTQLDEESERDFIYPDSKFDLGNGWKSIAVEKVGGEGQGDEYWSVVKLVSPTGDETFWEIPGFYQSHYGAELYFEDTKRVWKKEKMTHYWSNKE